MSTLKEKLANFNPKSEVYKNLEDNFEDLATSFLYGGHISVKDHKEERYRIYIRTVEFYCHHEGDNEDLPKDPIVYHRNGRYVEGDVPYFPLLSLHAHASGYDITFENQDLQLRSSALIRAYEVYDVKRKTYLYYDREIKLFVSGNDPKVRVNTQSTYLYNFLNGFGSDNIKWVDTLIPEHHEGLKRSKRQNVYDYEYDENKKDWIKQPVKDEREWSFTRLDEIENV